jgi:hypothetical protein
MSRPTELLVDHECLFWETIHVEGYDDFDAEAAESVACTTIGGSFCIIIVMCWFRVKVQNASLLGRMPNAESV